MVVLGGTLLAVALVAAFALVVCTAFLVHETMRVRNADARMRASLRTKVALLWYARASDLAVSARSVRASDDEAQAESELRAHSQADPWVLGAPLGNGRGPGGQGVVRIASLDGRPCHHD
jgi:hypothetical protein